MSQREKPSVEVPSGQSPSYQLELEDIEEGGGDEAVAGRVVEVHYVGVSASGEQFDARGPRKTFSSSSERQVTRAGTGRGGSGRRPAPHQEHSEPGYASAARRSHRADEPRLVVDLVGVR